MKFDPQRHEVVAIDRETREHIHCCLADILASQQTSGGAGDLDRLEQALEAVTGAMTNAVADLQSRIRQLEADRPADDDMPAFLRRHRGDDDMRYDPQRHAISARDKTTGEHVPDLEITTEAPTPPTDEERRKIAIRSVHEAVSDIVGSPAEQIRYELATMARNGSGYALDLLGSEARARGLSAADLAASILDERRNRERRVAAAAGIVAGFTTRCQSASPTLGVDEVEALAKQSVAEIRGA